MPEYVLPDIRRRTDGRTVERPDQWSARRSENLFVFDEQVYGIAPEAPGGMRFQLLEEEASALGRLARRKQDPVEFTAEPSRRGMEIPLYTPAAADSPVPLIAGLNLGGHQTVHPDLAIRVSIRWMRDWDGGVANRATEVTRVRSASRWQREAIVMGGYGLATICCDDDLDPHFNDRFRDGLHVLAPPRLPDGWEPLALGHGV